MEVVIEDFKPKKKIVRKKKTTTDTLEKWKKVPGLPIPKDQKRFEKMAKRLNRYESMGQFKDGVFYCKLGKPIDEKRIMQYEAMCHKLVRQYLPSLVLWEAGYMYEDLIVMCTREIFLALLNGFDPVKALTSNASDPLKKAEIEKWKQENKEEAYQKAEKLIVYGRISSFLRRERYNFHPNQLGGKTISRELLLYSNQGELQQKEYRLGMFNPPNQSWMIDQNTYSLKDKLLKLLETQGVEAVKKRFNTLTSDEKEELVDLLVQSTHNELSVISNIMDGFGGESSCMSV